MLKALKGILVIKIEKEKAHRIPRLCDSPKIRPCLWVSGDYKQRTFPREKRKNTHPEIQT